LFGFYEGIIFTDARLAYPFPLNNLVSILFQATVATDTPVYAGPLNCI
jgi:hypothetical protein